MGSADLVIDNVLGRLAECEGFGTGLLAAGVLVVDSIALLLVGEATHDFVDDAHLE